MKIDFDEESRWEGFKWRITGIKWYPENWIGFGKKLMIVNYGWFGSLESAIKWCEKQKTSYSFPVG